MIRQKFIFYNSLKINILQKIFFNLIPVRLIIISQILLLVVVVGCEKKCEKPKKNSVKILTSKSWRVASEHEDKNPSSTPVGIIYYKVLDCEKDDIWRFGTNGILEINNGTEFCYAEQDTVSRSWYGYDVINNQLIFHSQCWDIIEISENQLKFQRPIVPSAGGGC